MTLISDIITNDTWPEWKPDRTCALRACHKSCFIWLKLVFFANLIYPLLQLCDFFFLLIKQDISVAGAITGSNNVFWNREFAVFRSEGFHSKVLKYSGNSAMVKTNRLGDLSWEWQCIPRDRRFWSASLCSSQCEKPFMISPPFHISVN